MPDDKDKPTETPAAKAVKAARAKAGDQAGGDATPPDDKDKPTETPAAKARICHENDRAGEGERRWKAQLMSHGPRVPRYLFTSIDATAKDVETFLLSVEKVADTKDANVFTKQLPD